MGIAMIGRISHRFCGTMKSCEQSGFGIVKTIRAASLAMMIATLTTWPADAQSTQPTTPNGVQLLIMIKTTLIAYSQANMTGNYSVLRDLAAPGFQQVNSVARLSEIYREERNKNLDLSPVVLLKPELLRPVAVDERGLLKYRGLFPQQAANGALHAGVSERRAEMAARRAWRHHRFFHAGGYVCPEARKPGLSGRGQAGRNRWRVCSELDWKLALLEGRVPLSRRPPGRNACAVLPFSSSRNFSRDGHLQPGVRRKNEMTRP